MFTSFFSKKKKPQRGIVSLRVEELEPRLAPAVLTEVVNGVLTVSAETGADLVGVRVVRVLSEDGQQSFFPVQVNTQTIPGGSGPNGEITLFDIDSILIQDIGDNANNIFRLFNFSHPEARPTPVTILAGAGNDQVLQSGSINGAETDIQGGPGFDRLIGAEGPQTINGGDDNDVISGGPGSDLLLGGPGNDILSDGDAAGFDDTEDFFFGGGGDDVLLSQRGKNQLDGGLGNDTYIYQPFQTRTVDDTIIERPDLDTDTVTFLSTSGFFINGDPNLQQIGVKLDLSSTAKQTVVPGLIDITLDNATGLENVIGSPLSDEIIGNDRDNVINGGKSTNITRDAQLANKDILKGGLGNDILRADFDTIPHEQRDTEEFRSSPLLGSTLEGGPGNDQLVSGMGNDILRGGADNDLYSYDLGLFHGEDGIEEDGECLDSDTLDFTEPFLSIPFNSFRLQLDSTEPQVVVPGFGIVPDDPVLTLNNDHGIEQALVIFDKIGFTTLANPACNPPSVDLQIRAEHEREEDFANADRQEQDPTGDQIEELTLPQTVSAKYLVKVVNTGGFAQSFFLTALDEVAEEKALGNIWNVVYRDEANNDITALITSGDGTGFETKVLSPGEAQIISIEMKAEASVPDGDVMKSLIFVTAEKGEFEGLDEVEARTTTGLVVNTEGDEEDPNNFGNSDLDGVPDVDKQTPGLQTTLRAALEFIHAMPLEVVPTITFDDKVTTIPVGNIANRPLPAIVKPVKIDASKADGEPGVQVIGRGAPANEHGLHFAEVKHEGEDFSLVKGLILSNFGGHGIFIEKSDNIKVQGNFVGTNASGTQKVPNFGDGVHIVSSSDVEIGGDRTQGLGNVISGNKGNGIQFTGQTLSEENANRVWGNIIGLDEQGENIIGNDQNGIFINNVGGVQIGQEGDGERNIISGNGTLDDQLNPIGNGVLILGPSAESNEVMNNYIGTNKAGDAARGNFVSGVRIADGALQNVVGDSTIDTQPGTAKANLISGNNLHGVELSGTEVSQTKVIANLIGTDKSGTIKVPNEGAGIHISGSNSARVSANLLAGNTGSGAEIVNGGASNRFVRNIIGLNLSLDQALGNSGDGLLITGGSSNNSIGLGSRGVTDRDNKNFIGGNDKAGIRISGISNNNLLVQSFVGAGFQAENLGNAQEGIVIEDGSNFNRIFGGIIGGNGFQGIRIRDSSDTAIESALIGLDFSILSNTRMGEPNGEEGISIENSSDNRVLQNVVRLNQGDGIVISAGENQNKAEGNIIERNQIVENGGHGLALLGARVEKTIVTGNRITSHELNGLDDEGGDGVHVRDAKNNFIGMTVSGSAPFFGTGDNDITFNETGIRLVGQATGNALLGNHIIGTNNRVSIDLSAPSDPASGFTANDQDSGNSDSPNHGQNSPDLAFGDFTPFDAAKGQLVAVHGTLEDTFPRAEFLIHFFTSIHNAGVSTPSASNLLHSRIIRTDSNGFDRFTTNFQLSFDAFSADSPFNSITATASRIIRGENGSITFETSELAKSIGLEVNQDANNDGIVDGFSPDGDDGDELGLNVAHLLVEKNNNNRDQFLLKLESRPVDNGQGQAGQLQNVAIDPIPTNIVNQINNNFPQIKLVMGLLRFDVEPRFEGGQVVRVFLPPGFIANRYLKLKIDPTDPETDLDLDENGQLQFFDLQEAEDRTKTGAQLVQFDEVDQNGAVIPRLAFDLFLQDGKRGDLDQIANGVIVDPGIAVLVPEDFGDAPAPFPTLLADDGAVHAALGPFLGERRDSEADGIPDPAALGDDNDNENDEDGVTIGVLQIGQVGATATVTVQGAPNGAKLDAWIDFHGDGSWDDADQIADNLDVADGANVIAFDVPGDALDGAVFARFRLSTQGDLLPTGFANNGEVEDYQVTIANAVPQDLVVDNPLDENDGDFSQGNLSLREAVGIANARPGKDTITFDVTAFPQGQNTVMALDAPLGKMQLADDVDIVGLGTDRITVDAGGNSRHFGVLPGVQALLQGLTLQGGHDNIGGSILVFGGGRLDVEQVVLQNNNAGRAGGAIYAAGAAQVRVTGSTFANNASGDMGGALVAGSQSEVRVVDSTLRHNRAQRGGGLFGVFAKHVVFIGSTLHNNVATGQGGAAFLFASRLVMTNSTLSNNRALAEGGALFGAFGTMLVTHTTITGNKSSGAAVHLERGLRAFLQHTIVVGNLDRANNLFFDIFGAVQQRFTAFNIIGNRAGGIQHGRHGNHIGADLRQVLNPALRDNGSATLTHALIVGGLAHDGGATTLVTR